jgi:hypothetical protein
MIPTEEATTAFTHRRGLLTPTPLTPLAFKRAI